MALSLSKQYTFSSGTTIISAQVNADFDDLYNALTGLEGTTKSISNLIVDTILRSTGTIQSADGSASAPGFTFTSDTDNGLYRVTTNEWATAVGGTQHAVLNSSGIALKQGQFLAKRLANNATPDYSFDGDPNTGINNSTVDTMNIVLGGTQTVNILSTGIGVPNGAVGTPAYTFLLDANSGIYHTGSADTYAFAAGGAQVAVISSAGIAVKAGQVLAKPGGGGAAPDFSFDGDENTGISRTGADTINVYTGGSQRWGIDTTVHYYVSVSPNGAGALNSGDASNYWGDISYKTITDRGCLPWCDEGVELRNGQVVSDVEAIKKIKKHPSKKTVHGVPMLDYATFPKKAYRKATIDGKECQRDENDEPFVLDEKGEKKVASDGVEMTFVFGMMIGAIKELSDRIDKLEAA